MSSSSSSTSKSQYDSIREEINLNRYSSSLQSITPSLPTYEAVDDQQSKMIRAESRQYAIIDPSPRGVIWQLSSALVRPMKAVIWAVKQTSSGVPSLASAWRILSRQDDVVVDKQGCKKNKTQKSCGSFNAKKKMGSLILLRCGESTWTKTGRFTGWADPDLVTDGILEMEHASRLLLSEGYEPDMCYTSRLKRAVKSTWIVLNGLNAVYLPVYKSWRLNERHYGALTGLKKMDAARELGSEVVQAW